MKPASDRRSRTLRRALHLDFEQQVAALGQRSFERVPAGAVEVAGVLGVLEEVSGLDLAQKDL